jgi:CHAT domain-containing protein/tetratricopeptide (TPR) repeat protein
MINRGTPTNRRPLFHCFRDRRLLVLIFAGIVYIFATSTIVRSALPQEARQSDDPEFLLREAHDLRAKQQREFNEAAVQKYLKVSHLLRNGGELARSADALTNAGQTFEEMGDLNNARRSFQDALELSRKAKDVLQEGNALNGLASVYFLTGESSAAHEASLKALGCANRVNDNRLKAAALTNLGESVFASGDLPRALKYQQEASDLWKALGDIRGFVSSQIGLGYYSANLSEPQNALVYLEGGFRSAEEAGDFRGQMLALNALGNVKSKLGRTQEALDDYAKAKPLAERIGDRLFWASIVGGAGSLYFRLGDAERARECEEQAAATFDSIGAWWGVAEAKLDLGRINSELGNHDKAISYLKEALTLFRSQGMKRLEAQALRYIGIVQGSNGDYRASLQTFQQSIKLSRLDQDYSYVADAHNLVGKDYEQLSDNKKALQNYRQALQLSRIASDPIVESNSLCNIARIERDQGFLSEAEEKLEAALKIAESIRGNVSNQDLRASYLAKIHEIYELYIDVLMLQNKQNPNKGFDARAFAISERARARSLLESLQEGQADIRQGVDDALLEKERALRETVNSKAERHMKLLAAKDSQQAEKVKSEIDALTIEYSRVRDQIRATSPQYAALIAPELFTLQQVQQQLLDQESILLEYSLGDERSYVWLVTAGNVSTYELPSRKDIEQAARQLYNDFVAYQIVAGESLQARTERQKKADESLPGDTASLSKLVLGSLGGKLGNKRLVIVSDGALQYIPFAALHDPDANSNALQYLNEKHEIVREPSASTLALLLSEARRRAAPSDSVAVFADPVFEVDDPRVKAASYVATPESPESLRVKEALRDIGISADGIEIPRLIASSDEADAIINAAPWGTGLKAIGFDANRGRVLGQELGRYRIVHFATHGMINNEHPELSGIVLSLFDQQGRSQDGFLRLHDIYNLHLPADLVVLSACSSGLGKDVRGEGLIGLTRGFMYAGASGVVASLWKVDDRATAELMKLFYQGLFKKGLPPAAALRDAQLQMSQQKAWRSPYYWAGFIIQGRYDEQLNGSRFTYLSAKKIAMVSVFVAVVLLGAILIIRGRRSHAT